jgi:hypothetical protein
MLETDHLKKKLQQEKINLHRKKILSYINYETHIYIGQRNTTITFNESKNKIIYFDINDVCNQFFEYAQEPNDYYNLSYQDELLYY